MSWQAPARAAASLAQGAVRAIGWNLDGRLVRRAVSEAAQQHAMDRGVPLFEASEFADCVGRAVRAASKIADVGPEDERDEGASFDEKLKTWCARSALSARIDDVRFHFADEAEGVFRRIRSSSECRERFQFLQEWHEGDDRAQARLTCQRIATIASRKRETPVAKRLFVGKSRARSFAGYHNDNVLSTRRWGWRAFPVVVATFVASFSVAASVDGQIQDWEGQVAASAAALAGVGVVVGKRWEASTIQRSITEPASRVCQLLVNFSGGDSSGLRSASDDPFALAAAIAARDSELAALHRLNGKELDTLAEAAEQLSLRAGPLIDLLPPYETKPGEVIGTARSDLRQLESAVAELRNLAADNRTDLKLLEVKIREAVNRLVAATYGLLTFAAATWDPEARDDPNDLM